jgi:outer membrane protein W
LKTILLAVFVFAATPVWAQVEFRPFFLVTGERMAAQKTFDAALGSGTQPFVGGGLDVTVRRKFFVEFDVSHLSKTGTRFFVDDAGNVYKLNIASRITVTPVEVSAGRRFIRRRSRVIPYVGLGVGWYSYHQDDDFSEATENVNETHAGFLATGGAEFRLSKWVGVTADARYTHVPGILGQSAKTSGSQALNETDLGGIAARLRVIIGR